MAGLSVLDAAALVLFAICYFGYAWATAHGPLKSRHGLVEAIDAHRIGWMRASARRHVRIVDAQLLVALANGTAFFASTSVIVIGGLAAMLGAADDVQARLNELPFATGTPIAAIEIKICFVMALVIRAFFKFAWAFRLTHYTSIMLGAMPERDDPDASDAEREEHADRTARLSSLAALHMNGGLRTMYFAIAGLGWFIHPLGFMVACAWVVAVLYRREYRSRALAAVSGTERKPLV